MAFATAAAAAATASTAGASVGLIGFGATAAAAGAALVPVSAAAIAGTTFVSAFGSAISTGVQIVSAAGTIINSVTNVANAGLASAAPIIENRLAEQEAELITLEANLEALRLETDAVRLSEQRDTIALASEIEQNNIRESFIRTVQKANAQLSSRGGLLQSSPSFKALQRESKRQFERDARIALLNAGDRVNQLDAEIEQRVFDADSIRSSARLRRRIPFLESAARVARRGLPRIGDAISTTTRAIDDIRSVFQ